MGSLPTANQETIEAAAAGMIKSNLQELAFQRRFGPIRIGMTFGEVSDVPEIQRDPRAWNKSDLDVGKPLGWFRFGNLEIHVGVNDGPTSNVSLLTVKPSSRDLSALDEDGQFIFDSEGIYKGQSAAGVMRALRRLHIPSTQTTHNDAMHIYEFSAHAHLIFHRREGYDAITLYQIEIR